MLVPPLHWYHTLPAAVPHFGPFNAHFVRDIGCAFLTVGGAMLVAARRPELRAALTAVGASFAGLHAAVHAWDTARGHVPARHWLIDLPGVYAPAVVLLWLWWSLARERHSLG